MDDEIFIRSALQLYLETLGFQVLVAESGEKAIEIFTGGGSQFDLVILDLVMPGLQGIEVLRILKEKNPSVEVIIATGCGSMGTAVEALRYGAFDYITKPIVNFDQDLLKVVREAISSRRVKMEPGRAKFGPSGSDVTERRLLLLDQFTEIAALANRPRGDEATLELVEDLLLRSIGAGAGILLSVPPPPQDPVPVYTWGISGTPSLREVRWSDSVILKTFRRGRLGILPIDKLGSGDLGLPSEDLTGWQEVVCLPLLFAGTAWGAILLFFAEKFPEHLGGPLERHPFQILAPLLASIFASSLRYPLSQTSM